MLVTARTTFGTVTRVVKPTTIVRLMLLDAANDLTLFITEEGDD
jgi:hypothetical protein